MTIQRSLAAASFALACSCANLLGLDDYEPPGSTTASTTGSTTGNGGMAGSSAGGTGGTSAAGNGGGCAAEVISVPLEADTYITPNECAVANHWGMEPNINIGQGRGLFRFGLSPEVTSAFADQRVTRLLLGLTRNVAVCPSCVGSGLLRAYPLRNDWSQGDMMAGYDGADWCRRLSGRGTEEWDADGASGPEDVGELSAEQTVDAMQDTVELELAVDAHANWAGESISVRVIGANGAAFVAYSRESAGPPASLTISYCPP